MRPLLPDCPGINRFKVSFRGSPHHKRTGLQLKDVKLAGMGRKWGEMGLRAASIGLNHGDSVCESQDAGAVGADHDVSVKIAVRARRADRRQIVPPVRHCIAA